MTLHNVKNYRIAAALRFVDQWRRQESEVRGQRSEGLGDGSPPAGSMGEAPQKLKGINKFYAYDHARACILPLLFLIYHHVRELLDFQEVTT